MVEKPLYRPADVVYMHPATSLSSVSLSSAKPKSHQAPEGDQRPAIAKRDRSTQRHLSGEGRSLAEEGLFPAFAYLHRKVVFDLPGIFILRAVLRMAVYGSRSHIDPKLWRYGCFAYGLSDRFGGIDPAVEDFLSVAPGIPAIDAAPGQIDHDITAVDGRRPMRLHLFSVPVSAAGYFPSEDDDMIVVLPAVSECLADKTAATGYNYFFIFHICIFRTFSK